MLIRAAVVDDAEALTDLHLDVWEEAYAGLMPDSIFTETPWGYQRNDLVFPTGPYNGTWPTVFTMEGYSGATRGDGPNATVHSAFKHVVCKVRETSLDPSKLPARLALGRP